MATDSKGAFSEWSSPMTFTIAANSPPGTPSHLQNTQLARFEAQKQAKDTHAAIRASRQEARNKARDDLQGQAD